MDSIQSTRHAVVVGAGPGGLAMAAELARIGVPAVVLEQANRVGARWPGHYDRLHLHTARTLSSLPFTAIPRREGRWVTRDAFANYLSEYASIHRLDVRFGVQVTSVNRVADGRWTVEWTSTSGHGLVPGEIHGTVVAPLVVVATGYNHTPYVPPWPGLDAYEGRVIHSSAYRNPHDLGAQAALVVGPGNSGGEIAADLAEAGVRVMLAIRTPPNIVRRQVGGVPGQVLAIAIKPLPVAAGDRIAGWVQRQTVGDLSRFGIPVSTRGVVTQMVRDGITPTIDAGLLDALRAGAVTVVPAVTGFKHESVQLADGRLVSPDAVVAATGYRRGLESLVGHLDVLTESGLPRVNAAQQLPPHAGLYFLGYSNPLSGNLLQLRIDSRAIARHWKAARAA